MQTEEMAKDDFLEALMGVVEKVTSYYKKRFQKEKENVDNEKDDLIPLDVKEGLEEQNTDKEEVELLLLNEGNYKNEVGFLNQANYKNMNLLVLNQDNNKIMIFQESMKYIMMNTDNKNIFSLARNFHENPVESMKLLQSVISEKTIEMSQNLVIESKETAKLIESVRSTIDVIEPNAINQITTINNLQSSEFNKIKLAENALNDLRPFNQKLDNIQKNEEEKENIKRNNEVKHEKTEELER